MVEHDNSRARAVIAQAAELPQEKRGEFLEAACHGDAVLRADVESLLSYDSSFELAERDQSFPESPLVRVTEATLRVQRALSKLDSIDREVLTLRHFEQLGRAQAAKVLGISQEDGAKRYFRALKRLKEELASLPGSPEGT
jgi:RNA polymerase sigma factor (sigma-70 family)